MGRYVKCTKSIYTQTTKQESFDNSHIRKEKESINLKAGKNGEGWKKEALERLEERKG